MTPTQAAWQALKARRELEAEIAAARRAGVTLAELRKIAARNPSARRFTAAIEATA